MFDVYCFYLLIFKLLTHRGDFNQKMREYAYCVVLYMSWQLPSLVRFPLPVSFYQRLHTQLHLHITLLLSDGWADGRGLGTGKRQCSFGNPGALYGNVFSLLSSLRGSTVPSSAATGLSHNQSSYTLAPATTLCLRRRT